MAHYTGAPFAVSVNSCTNALFLSCKWVGVVGQPLGLGWALGLGLFYPSKPGYKYVGSAGSLVRYKFWLANQSAPLARLAIPSELSLGTYFFWGSGS